MYFLATALELDVVKLQVPVHEVLHALLDRCGRLVTDVVTNSPTVYEALRLKWDIPDPLTKKAKYREGTL